MLRARQLFEFKPAAVAAFQSTAELDGRASGHTTAFTAVLAHCERHLANRHCIFNCLSQLVPLCDGNSTAFLFSGSK
jgi:cellobiose-specific phosphotransferase system component IIA